MPLLGKSICFLQSFNSHSKMQNIIPRHKIDLFHLSMQKHPQIYVLDITGEEVGSLRHS